MDTIMEGGHPASREIREAIEWKAPQRVEDMGPEWKEVTIQAVYDGPRKRLGKVGDE
jgi:hypothetical protein